jgi:indole-3-glycerol phosphate synthase/phosphoribosylanthranilate isomerase
MRFREALAQPDLGGIAEVKRRSPSAGDLRPDAEPGALARAYERAGAAAVSILVDERFGGTWDDLRAARAAARLPLLAKGFFSTDEDLRTARDAGADAVLLILRDLDDAASRRFLDGAAALGLDVLVEAHDAEELARATALGAEVIGINARDLSTFHIDRRAQLELVAQAPQDRVLVAESGIESRAQAAAAELAGAAAVLIGSTLMRAPDPGEKLKELLSRPLVKVCGLTRQEDVDVAAEAGADMAGFILARETPRRAPRVLDVPDTMLSVAVYVGERGEDDADLVQLYELEDDHRSSEAVLLRGDEEVARVVDREWQTRGTAHLDRARTMQGRVIVAGGIGPHNVRDAIRRVRPWGVDASSSLEIAPGVKDHARIREYVEAARL